MLLVVCIISAIQLSMSQSAEIIPRPSVSTENKPVDAAAPEAVAPVDVPVINFGELLGINAIVIPTDVDSPEPLWRLICGNG